MKRMGGRKNRNHDLHKIDRKKEYGFSEGRMGEFNGSFEGNVTSER
jgi:hypothetical protein